MKTIVITGATSGIGFALAKYYLKQGNRVVIIGRKQNNLNMAKERLLSYSNLVIFKLADVRDSSLIRDIILELDDLFQIDIIVANAGVSAAVYNIVDFDKVSREIFDINVQGVFNTIHPIIERMIKRQKGQIVLISSMSAFFGLTSAIFYASSKAAIKSYGEGLRILLLKHNISVSLVFPGFVESNITKNNSSSMPMPFLMTAEKAANIIGKKLRKRKGYISFPFRMRIIVYLIYILPFVLREKIVKYMPQK